MTWQHIQYVRFATIIVALLVVATPSFANNKIVLNTGIRDPFTTQDNQGFIDQLLREVFRRIGVEAEVIVYQTASKSLTNANAGIDDGAALRVKGLESKFPNLIQVPEKLMDNDFVAYSLGLDVVTDDWSSLDQHRIAYINGWQIFQNNLGHHNKTTKTENAQQMIDLLTNDSVDMVLYERWQGLWRASQLGISLTGHEPPLAQREMFMYLHKKHEDIVAPAAKALADMKTDGTYQTIFDKTLGVYLDQ
ncbi:MAG: transporter substrate-binding domain-containing protein [Rhodospirillales bacterium]|nr:transporter substrate-binding domain-containing protein [Rhodospirillales bacterium]